MPSYLTSRDLVADNLNQGVGGPTVTNMVRPEYPFNETQQPPQGMKKGGAVKRKKPKCMARGGGCEVRGKTKGRIV